MLRLQLIKQWYVCHLRIPGPFRNLRNILADLATEWQYLAHEHIYLCFFCLSALYYAVINRLLNFLICHFDSLHNTASVMFYLYKPRDSSFSHGCLIASANVILFYGSFCSNPPIKSNSYFGDYSLNFGLSSKSDYSFFTTASIKALREFSLNGCLIVQ